MTNQITNEDLEKVSLDPMTENDTLVSNTEILERQLYYLATIKSYLEDQLKQIDQVAKNVQSQLNSQQS